jgi:hypothetical protein
VTAERGVQITLCVVGLKELICSLSCEQSTSATTHQPQCRLMLPRLASKSAPGNCNAKHWAIRWLKKSPSHDFRAARVMSGVSPNFGKRRLPLFPRYQCNDLQWQVRVRVVSGLDETGRVQIPQISHLLPSGLFCLSRHRTIPFA